MTGRRTERLARTSTRWRGIARLDDAAFADDLKLGRDRTARIGLDVITTLTGVLVNAATAIGVVVVLVISHRLSTVRRAGHILVLDGGRITGRGTHDELVALDGEYARLFAMQADRFR